MTITTSFQRGFNKVFILGLVAVVAACGGGGGGGGGGGNTNSQPAISSVPASSATVSVTSSSSSSSSSVIAPFLMGGAIQGMPLNVANVVTTFAGTPPGKDGTGIQAKFNSPHGVVSDGTNLYVADYGNSTIRKMVIATGVVTTLAGTAQEYGSADGTGAAARFSVPTDITIVGPNLYVADAYSHTIRKIVIATGVVTTLAGTAGAEGSADGTGAAARFNYPFGITTDNTNLYVTDFDNFTIRKIVIATGVVTTLAGSAGAEGTADGVGATARFGPLSGITTDNTNLYVSDVYSHTIRRIVIDTGVVTTLAGTANTTGSADGTGAAASFNHPQGIVTDNTNLYVADEGNSTIRKIVIATGAVTTLAGTAGTKGNADATGSTASFNAPYGIAIVGPDLYVTDEVNDTIRKVAITTGLVTTLAGTSDMTDGAGAAAGFSGPSGITTDGSNLYVTDNYRNIIRKIVIATGAVTTLAGQVSIEGSADGVGTAAAFDSPEGITTDGTNLYVADRLNHTIRKIVIATGAVTTFAGAADDQDNIDGPAATARFDYPNGITTDGSNLYVTDDSFTIRKIVISSGVVTTFAGTAGMSGSIDGIGAAARFNYPSGITTDGSNLYVADGSSIRKIVIATGAVTTLAGTHSIAGSADGTGTAAAFYSAEAITTDGTNLYVSDIGNQNIRKIVIATQAVTTLAGTTETSGSADGIVTAATFRFPTGITTDGVNLYITDFGNNTIRKIH